MQNAVAEIDEGRNIAKSSDVVLMESNEQNAERGEPVAAVLEPRVPEPKISREPASAQIPLGGIGDGVPTMHGDFSLEKCSDLSHMGVDGCRDASHSTGLLGHDEKLESGMRT